MAKCEVRQYGTSWANCGLVGPKKETAVLAFTELKRLLAVGGRVRNMRRGRTCPPAQPPREICRGGGASTAMDRRQPLLPYMMTYRCLGEESAHTYDGRVVLRVAAGLLLQMDAGHSHRLLLLGSRSTRRSTPPSLPRDSTVRVRVGWPPRDSCKAL
jgi:hypothetical protein